MVNPLVPADWPIAVSDLPPETYLVGGSVRDALLGRLQADLDLDFVTPGPAVPLAKRLAQQYQASLVILDAERSIARLVFPQATLDFAQRLGASLTEDLARRDFTINAIAYDPRTEALIDPLQGRHGIANQEIALIARENLSADPLRVLRAYRQASQLGFTITAATRQGLQDFAPELATVAPERIRTELNYLLASPESHIYLRMAWEDGALRLALPDLGELQLEHLQHLEQFTISPNSTWAEIIPTLTTPLLSNPGPGEPRKRTLLTMTKLACLLTSHLSAQVDPKTIQATLGPLTYSNREIKLVQLLLQGLPQLIQTLESNTRSTQFYLFRHMGGAWPGLARLGLSLGLDPESLVLLNQAWLDPDNPIAHPPCLVTGADLIQQFQIAPGPGIGKLLNSIVAAQAGGDLTTTEQALAWVEQHLHDYQ